jgi:hypothetical protein
MRIKTVGRASRFDDHIFFFVIVSISRDSVRDLGVFLIEGAVGARYVIPEDHVPESSHSYNIS